MVFQPSFQSGSVTVAMVILYLFLVLVSLHPVLATQGPTGQGAVATGPTAGPSQDRPFTIDYIPMDCQIEVKPGSVGKVVMESVGVASKEICLSICWQVKTQGHKCDFINYMKNDKRCKLFTTLSSAKILQKGIGDNVVPIKCEKRPEEATPKRHISLQYSAMECIGERHPDSIYEPSSVKQQGLQLLLEEVVMITDFVKDEVTCASICYQLLMQGISCYSVNFVKSKDGSRCELLRIEQLDEGAKLKSQKGSTFYRVQRCCKINDGTTSNDNNGQKKATATDGSCPQGNPSKPPQTTPIAVEPPMGPTWNPMSPPEIPTSPLKPTSPPQNPVSSTEKPTSIPPPEKPTSMPEPEKPMSIPEPEKPTPPMAPAPPPTSPESTPETPPPPPKKPDQASPLEKPISPQDTPTSPPGTDASSHQAVSQPGKPPKVPPKAPTQTSGAPTSPASSSSDQSPSSSSSSSSSSPATQETTTIPQPTRALCSRGSSNRAPFEYVLSHRTEGTMSFQHYLRVPYLAKLDNTIQPGQSLLVRGVTVGNTININLATGPNVGTYRDDNVALHVSWRAHQQAIVFNTLEGRQWRNEERYGGGGVREGEEIDILIRAQSDHFEVFVDQKKLADFRFRLPLKSITHVFVTGDICLQALTWEGNSYTIPYRGQVPGGFGPGKKLFFIARPDKSAYNFVINLYVRYDIAYHFSARFNEWSVVRNSRRGGAWESEEREGKFPFTKNKQFDLIIVSEGGALQAYVNGEHHSTFRNRFNPSQIDGFSVEGDIKLKSIALD